MTRDPSGMAVPSTVRSIASLALFVHLFCLALVLTSNQAASPLQQRLLFVFRPYTQLLNFDVSYTRFDYTQETIDDADQRIEYLPEGKSNAQASDWVHLTAGSPGSDRLQRYQRLAGVMSFFASREDDGTTAVIAAAIGTHLYRHDEPIDEIRVRRHVLQTPDQVRGTSVAERDPFDPMFFQDVYRAQVIDGGEAVQKVEERGQVAPPTRASGQSPRRSEGRGAVPGTRTEAEAKPAP
ncbi:MAG: hypothetical protein U0939_06285 [Pirellulales bacterium]